MKICIIGMANSVHIAPWCNYLEKDYEVHLISEEEPKDKKIDLLKNIKIHFIKRPLNNGFLNLIINAFRVRSLLKKIKPDIVHAHCVTVPGFWAAFSGFHPYVLSPWGNDVTVDPYRCGGLLKIITKYSLKHADLVNVNDKASYYYLKKISKKSNLKIFKMMGINPNIAVPIKKGKIKGRAIIITHARELSEKYNSKVFLESIPYIIKGFKDVKFRMLRKGPLIEKFDRIIEETGIKEYIEFYDWVPYKEFPRILGEADIYVDTHYRKYPGSGLGMTTFTAMSCELPVVIPNTPGIEEYIKQGYNGFMYEGLNHKSLANTVLILLRDDKLRKKIGDNAREYVLKEGDYEKNMKRMLREYNLLLKK